MKFIIDFIPHSKQRYDTCGDYYDSLINDEPVVFFKISDTGNEAYNNLILYHEMREYMLSKKRGIKLNDIDKFDMEFKGEGEPGDDKNAPYFNEHQLATLDERRLAYDMGIDWDEYEKTIYSL